MKKTKPWSQNPASCTPIEAVSGQFSTIVSSSSDSEIKIKIFRNQKLFLVRVLIKKNHKIWFVPCFVSLGVISRYSSFFFRSRKFSKRKELSLKKNIFSSSPNNYEKNEKKFCLQENFCRFFYIREKHLQNDGFVSHIDVIVPEILVPRNRLGKFLSLIFSP